MPDANLTMVLVGMTKCGQRFYVWLLFGAQLQWPQKPLARKNMQLNHDDISRLWIFILFTLNPTQINSSVLDLFGNFRNGGNVRNIRNVENVRNVILNMTKPYYTKYHQISNNNKSTNFQPVADIVLLYLFCNFFQQKYWKLVKLHVSKRHTTLVA